MTNQTQSHVVQPQPHDEEILVLKRTLFPAIDTWHGLRAVDYVEYAALVQRHKEFLPRSLMEQDPTYKQIIPYLVFTHEGRYFLMQRQAKATETRLQNKFTLGIGGHIRHEDMLESADVMQWAKREFEEEVAYNGSYTIEPLGILNDDSNSVGQVHIGFVYLLHGTSDAIAIRSEMKSGVLYTLQECLERYDSMETWSQIVLDFLHERHRK